MWYNRLYFYYVALGISCILWVSIKLCLPLPPPHKTQFCVCQCTDCLCIKTHPATSLSSKVCVCTPKKWLILRWLARDCLERDVMVSGLFSWVERQGTKCIWEREVWVRKPKSVWQAAFWSSVKLVGWLWRSSSEMMLRVWVSLVKNPAG